MEKPVTYRHALVTGASGFVGRVLCTYLVQQGVRVTAVSRTAHSLPWFSATQYKSHSLDIIKVALPTEWWDGVDVVFHLAGMAHVGDKSKISDETYQSINVGATDTLLQQAVLHDVKRFIYFSSVRAIDPVDRYGYNKRLAEETVLSYGEQKAIQVSILRPVLVYGPGVKGNLRVLQNAIQKGWLPPIPETGNRRSLISVQDLAHAAWITAISPYTHGKTYIVTDGVAYSTRQIYEVFSRLSGRQPGRLAVPKWIFWLVTKLLCKPHIFEKLFGSDFYPDVALSIDTGWEPQYSLWDVDHWNTVFSVHSAQHGE
jgi:nucleoside-diphosphate-sugar epimerase